MLRGRTTSLGSSKTADGYTPPGPSCPQQATRQVQTILNDQKRLIFLLVLRHVSRYSQITGWNWNQMVGIDTTGPGRQCYAMGTHP